MARHRTPRPWTRASAGTRVGVPPAPTRPGQDLDDDDDEAATAHADATRASTSPDSAGPDDVLDTHGDDDAGHDDAGHDDAGHDDAYDATHATYASYGDDDDAAFDAPIDDDDLTHAGPTGFGLGFVGFDSRPSQTIPAFIDGDTARVSELQLAELDRTAPVGDETKQLRVPRTPSKPADTARDLGRETDVVAALQVRAPAPARSGGGSPTTRPLKRTAAPPDPESVLRACIAQVRATPLDHEARRKLRATAVTAAKRDQLVALLGEEARAAERPAVAAAFYEELADLLEDLDRPLDAIAALERLVQLAPRELLHHDRLARLYHRARAWLKAAEAFEQVAALAIDPRAALGAAARLYREHGRPERAIELYRAIAARHPTGHEAWRTLDELLESLGRWRELAEVRGQLAVRAQASVEKAALLRAQARALEAAGDREAAARAIAEAARLAPEQVSGVVDYADVLARNGRGLEAAELLARRVAEAVARGAPDEDLAALRLRHAAILDDACGDRAGAAAVLDELLAHSPRYLPALERLVWHAAHDPDPRVHAAALVRQAAALDGTSKVADRAALLVEAARRFRDAGDRAAAARAFEQACELAPGNADLERERDQARAALLVYRAAEDAKTGDLASAERRLRAVLATQPHDVEAHLALVELLEERDTGDAEAARKSLEDAADHLYIVLDEQPDPFPPAGRARIVHRYAGLVAALGAADEAHQLLHEAHRLDRRNLLVTLALGDSCFARKLWRESALHLGSLADHPDAARHATAVSAALVRAALADTRALRPGNAEGRYTAAVKIDPACAAAWRGLAELARERGDLAAAAGYLEREAAATTDPRDRTRLYTAVGDLARDELHDPVLAERCWTEILDTAAVPTLEKLLAVQRRRGAGAERARTCERLAELASDPWAKKELLEEAADAFLADGELEEATALAHRLIATHPLDLDAVACATAVAIAAADFESTAAWLGRALTAWDAETGSRAAGRSPDHAALSPRIAELWRRLGDARLARKDVAGAQLAFERAVATAPESDGAHASRRWLVALATAAGRSAGASLAGLVAAEQDPDDVLAWAREHVADDTPEDARPLYELAQALGAALSADDEDFLAAHPPRVMASDQAYAAPLAEADRRALVDDEADAPLAELLAMAGEVAALVCPSAGAALAESELADLERLSASSPLAAAAVYPQIAKALGGPVALLHTTSSRHAADVTLLSAAPPVVVIGPRLAAQRAQSHAGVPASHDAELRFRLGRAVELARIHRSFAAGVAPDRFVRFVDSLRWAVLHPDADAPDPAVAREAKRLRAAIPLLVRRRLAERIGELDAPLDPAGYLAACERAADRSGLLACGDVGVAIRLAGGPRVARHLVRTAASARFLAARRQLWAERRRK